MLCVNNTAVLVHLEVLSITIMKIRLPHFVHHEILFVFDLAKHHCKDRKKFRQLIYMYIWGESFIKNLIVRPVEVVTLKYINHF